jgi:hypothetical protein
MLNISQKWGSSFIKIFKKKAKPTGKRVKQAKLLP